MFLNLKFLFKKFKKTRIIIGLFNLLIAGLWHSVTFRFIIWGLFQAIILSIEFILK